MIRKRNIHKNKVLDNNLVRFLLVLLLLAACAGIGSGYAVYEDRSDPTQIVAEYFGQFLLRKYDKMLEYVDTDDYMISKERFTVLMKDLREKSNIAEYEFKKPQETKDGRYYVRVTYTDASTSESKYMDIFLAQKKNIVTNAFTEWKISINEYISEDLAVAVPKGMKLEIDSEKIDETMAVISTESMSEIDAGDGKTVKLAGADKEMDIYHIKNILSGMHKFKAYGAYSQIIEDRTVGKYGTRVVLSKEDEIVNNGYKKKIRETTESMISEYYNAVKDRKLSTKKLMACFADDKELKNTLKKYTGKDIARIYWEDVRYIDDYSLKEQNFSKIKLNPKYIGNNTFEVDCNFTFSYRCATDTDVYISYVSSYTGKCDVKMKITYKRDGDKLIITAIDKKTEDHRDEQ